MDLAVVDLAEETINLLFQVLQEQLTLAVVAVELQGLLVVQQRKQEMVVQE